MVSLQLILGQSQSMEELIKLINKMIFTSHDVYICKSFASYSITTIIRFHCELYVICMVLLLFRC